MLKYLYHSFMVRWYGLLIWLNMRIFRFKGEFIHGLPSLKEYSDKQVIEGLRQMKEQKKKMPGYRQLD